MALPLFKEKRMNPRKKLTGLLPGRMMMEASERTLSVRPIDVSRDGMGVLIREELKQGSFVILRTDLEDIRLQVAWTQEDFGKQDLFRYGLVTTDSKVDLEQLFRSRGCLEG